MQIGGQTVRVITVGNRYRIEEVNSRWRAQTAFFVYDAMSDEFGGPFWSEKVAREWIAAGKETRQ